MSDESNKKPTKECDGCGVPVPVDAPKHQTSGDHLHAARKYIREIRSENERLRGTFKEHGLDHLAGN